MPHQIPFLHPSPPSPSKVSDNFWHNSSHYNLKPKIETLICGLQDLHLLQMYWVSCKNLGKVHYFALVLFSSVESSVNCMTSCFLPPLLLCPLAVTSPCSTASQEAGSSLGCSEQPAHSVPHLYTEGGRKGRDFVDPHCSKDRPTSSCTPLPRHCYRDHKIK